MRELQQGRCAHQAREAIRSAEAPTESAAITASQPEGCSQGWVHLPRQPTRGLCRPNWRARACSHERCNQGRKFTPADKKDFVGRSTAAVRCRDEELCSLIGCWVLGAGCAHAHAGQPHAPQPVAN